MIELRPYQRECVDTHFAYFAEKTGNPLFVVPTGGGKSVIMAAFLNETFTTWSDQRVLVVTHVKELIAQNYARFLDHWPTAPAGIYSAGLGRRDEDEPIIFAGIQSIAHRPDDLGVFDLVLVDEVQLCPKKGTGRYRKYLGWMREKNPNLKVLGYTATPYRMDGGLLHKGKGRIFTDIAYDVSLRRLIDEGWLVTIRSKAPVETIDTKGVHVRKGEFVAAELEAAAMKDDLVSLTVRDMVTTGRVEGRKHWLVFGCTVAHAEALRFALREHGVDAWSVYGDTPKDKRDTLIEAFRRGEIECLVNCQLLTVGFDAPCIDLLAIVRPTKSTGLFVQIAGRSLRLSPDTGKHDALLLDYGGNIERHGPLTDIRPRQPGAGGGVAPVKICPSCREVVHAGVMKCPACGHEWPPRETDHDDKASTADPLGKREPRWYVISGVTYYRHRKAGKPDSVRVDYACGITRVSEWLCPEHGGKPTRKASSWWSKRAKTPPPETVGGWLRHVQELVQPRRVKVGWDGKYQRVVDHDFAGDSAAADGESTEDGLRGGERSRDPTRGISRGEGHGDRDR